MKLQLFCLLIITTSLCHAADGECVKHLVAPGYPRLARISQMQGSVVVDLEIAPNGSVASVKASGAHKVLQEASAENIRQWIFCSTDTSEASRHLTLTYFYSLDGDKRYYDPPPHVVLDLPHRIEIKSHPYDPQP